MSCDEELSKITKHPFHPADPPYGCQNYDTKAIEPEQQESLNKVKSILRQDNEIYLKNHPEIRGLVSIILRHLLGKEATSSEEIQSLLSTFFNRPRTTIAAELLDYFLEKNVQGPIVDGLKTEIFSEETSERT